MQCSKCHKEAIITQAYSGRAYCINHLIDDIESRVKRDIRKKGGILSKEILYVEDMNDFRTFSLRIFLSSLLEKRTDIMFTAKMEEATTIVSPVTLDFVSTNILDTVLEGKQTVFLNTQSKRTLYPFASIPDEEIYIYATAYGWKESYSKQNSSSTDEFLSSFSTTRPGTRFALKNIKDSLEMIK